MSRARARAFPDAAAREIAAHIRKLSGPMIERENFVRAHRALHVLWTKHQGDPGYDKRLWWELDSAIHMLATDGPGELIPWPAAPPAAGGSEPGGDR